MNITKFIENIDNGGFGIVDQVLCDDMKIYARKTFSMNIPHDANLKKNALQRFKREATFQSSFSHKNIVPILFSDLENENPYYIMPLAEMVLKKIKLTNKDEIIRMLLDVMAGLEEMHNKSYYHRDLKPGNILRFVNDNGDYYYSIGDFGLLSIDQTNITDLTPVSMFKGSDYYTAPEIVESMARASVQSDIFSIGCLIHDYFGKGSRIPCQPILEDGAMGKLISICTQKKPIRRFKSISYLREALISISSIDLEMKSEEGNKLLNLVNAEGLLTYENWENIIDFLCNEKNEEEDINSLYKSINIKRITELINLDLYLADSYGILFSEWVRDRTFIFDFCDIIGRRLEIFIENCNMNTKSLCIISMLYMSTSHNRFFVEKLCYKWLSNQNDTELAERLAIEIMSEGKNICLVINHLEYSISVRRENFNPIILSTLNKQCKRE
jgi:serine/threonine protein kinase